MSTIVPHLLEHVHKPLGTKSPRDRIPSQKNCFKNHIWTKTPRTNPTQDKIPYRQYIYIPSDKIPYRKYPLGQNPLPI